METAKTETAVAKTDNKTEKTKAVNFREIAESKRDILYIDPKKIGVKDGYNVREDYGDIAELAGAIQESGMVNPIRIFQEKGQIFISDGHRRFEAVTQLLSKGVKIESIPCIVDEKGTTDEQRILRMMLANDGKNLTVLEQAEVVQRLSALGMTPQQIAKKTGRTQSTISNLKQLLSLPSEVVKEVRAGNIAANTAIELNRECKGNSEKLKEKLKEARETMVATGKKKITKKVIKKETRRNSKSEARDSLIALLDQAIEALKSSDEQKQFAAIEALQIYRDGLAVVK